MRGSKGRQIVTDYSFRVAGTVYSNEQNLQFFSIRPQPGENICQLGKSGRTDVWTIGETEKDNGWFVRKIGLGE